MTLQRARNAKGGCPIGSLAGQLAEQDEGARLELADGLDRWETAIREGLERMAARGELHTGADPGRACPKHPRSHPRRPAAHASPAGSQPAPLSPERRDQRDPRRARRTLILGADVMRTHPRAANDVRSNHKLDGAGAAVRCCCQNRESVDPTSSARNQRRRRMTTATRPHTNRSCLRSGCFDGPSAVPPSGVAPMRVGIARLARRPAARRGACAATPSAHRVLAAVSPVRKRARA